MTKQKTGSLLNNLPIRQKLVLTIFVVTFISIASGFALIISDTLASFRTGELTRIQHFARVVADFSVGPVAFDDRAGASERLSYLDTVPGIVSAHIVDNNGHLFASWDKTLKRSDQSQASDQSPGSAAKLIEVSKAIEYNERVLGTVVLTVSTKQLGRKIRHYLTTMAFILAAVVIISLLLAYRLQRAISGPILDLAKTTREVSLNHNYQARISGQIGGELGDLFDGFNKMMVEIQNRERERDQAQLELKKGQRNLERRIEERTRQLTRANELLNDEITERENAEARIKASLREKDVLLREIHHRVKNNLQTVYSLLFLQAEESDNEQLVRALEDSQLRIKTLATVHETLYRSEDLAQINIADIIRQIVDDVTAVYSLDSRSIEVSVDLADVILSLDQAIPAGLILNELLTNAFKYAFPKQQQGRIDVMLRKVDHRISIRVADNGVGMPKHLNWHNTPTLGLKLVKALADQLKGDIRQQPGSGTVFTLSFEPRAERPSI